VIVPCCVGKAACCPIPANIGLKEVSQSLPFAITSLASDVAHDYRQGGGRELLIVSQFPEGLQYRMMVLLPTKTKRSIVCLPPHAGRVNLHKSPMYDDDQDVAQQSKISYENKAVPSNTTASPY